MYFDNSGNEKAGMQMAGVFWIRVANLWFEV